MDEAAAWLEGRLAAGVPTGAPTLVHNVFKFDNVVLDSHEPTRIIGVLDGEMATYGEPMTDLGTTLAYWTEATDPDEMKTLPFGPTLTDGSLSRAAIVERWSSRTKREPIALGFYHAFAHYKIAVVAQQIYWRFKNGHTKDARFAAFIHAVAILGRAALRAREE
jgi:aminoglycoside phosphotransferase (APT) family kinase protein